MDRAFKHVIACGPAGRHCPSWHVLWDMKWGRENRKMNVFILHLGCAPAALMA